jgi:hypothetical protein
VISSIDGSSGYGRLFSSNDSKYFWTIWRINRDLGHNSYIGYMNSEKISLECGLKIQTKEVAT